MYWDVEGRNSTGGVMGCGGEKQHRRCTGMWRGETAQGVHWDVEGRNSTTVYWDVEGRNITGGVLGCGVEKQHRACTLNLILRHVHVITLVVDKQ